MIRRRSAWERLQERWVVGEPLTASEHCARIERATEPAADRELQFYEQASRWLDEASGSDTEDDARFLEHVLRVSKGGRATGLRLVGDARSTAAQARFRAPGAKSRVVPAAAWLLASAAAAAALGLVWRESRPEPSAGKTPQLLEVGAAHCQLSSLSGFVETPDASRPRFVGEALHEGDTLATGAGSACLTIDGGARVCLPSDSTLRLRSLNPKHIRIQVLRGGSIASLSPRPPGSFFSLMGQGLVATAHGTVFALELIRGNGAAEVTVLEGSVEVQGASDPTLVAAGSRAQFEHEGRSLPVLFVDRAARDRLRNWLDVPSQNAPSEASAVPEPAPPETPALPRLPITASAERPDSPAGLSRDALFAAARKQAGLGNARAARALYRELLTRYPGNGTASVQVVLGNLEMELAAPERALAAFEAYLRSGGPLEPEALHGKVRALRALGRAAEERATIRNYLARYPNGFQAPTLKKRLQELE